MAVGRLDIEVHLQDQASAQLADIKREIEGTAEGVKIPVEPVLGDNTEQVKANLTQEFGAIKASVEIEVDQARSRLNTLKSDAAEAVKANAEIDITDVLADINRVEAGFDDAITGRAEVDASGALREIDRIGDRLERALRGRVQVSGGGGGGGFTPRADTEGGLGLEDIPLVGAAGAGAVGTLALAASEGANLNLQRSNYEDAVRRYGYDKTATDAEVERIVSAGFTYAQAYAVLNEYMRRGVQIGGGNISQLLRYLRSRLSATVDADASGGRVAELAVALGREPEVAGGQLIEFLGVDFGYLDPEALEASVLLGQGLDVDAPFSYTTYQDEAAELLINQIVYLSQREEALAQIRARDEQVYYQGLDALARATGQGADVVARALEGDFESFLGTLPEGPGAATLRQQARETRRLQRAGITEPEAYSVSLLETTRGEDLLAEGRRARAERLQAESFEVTAEQFQSTIDAAINTTTRTFEELGRNPAELAALSQDQFNQLIEDSSDKVIDPLDRAITDAEAQLADAEPGSRLHTATLEYIDQLKGLRTDFDDQVEELQTARDAITAPLDIRTRPADVDTSGIVLEDAVSLAELRRAEVEGLEAFNSVVNNSSTALGRLNLAFEENTRLQNAATQSLNSLLTGDFSGVERTVFQYASDELAGTIGGAIGTALGGPAGAVIGNVIGQAAGELIGDDLGELFGNIETGLHTFGRAGGALISFFGGNDGRPKYLSPTGEGTYVIRDREEADTEAGIRLAYQLTEDYLGLTALEIFEELGYGDQVSRQDLINAVQTPAEVQGNNLIINLRGLQDGNEQQQQFLEFLQNVIIPLLEREFNLTREVGSP